MHFVDEKLRILFYILLNVAPNGAVNNNPSLVQIIVRRQPGDKAL